MHPELLVNMLLESDGMSHDDIKDYVADDKVELARGIEFNIGFAIGTADEFYIESNARDNGIELDWDVINAAIARIEQNAVNALNQAGVQCRSEGHSSTGELVGSAWVTGGTPGFEIVRTQMQMGEPYRTSSGSMDAIQNGFTNLLYQGVPDQIAGLVDIDISFFAVEDIERVENGEDLEESEDAIDPKEFVSRPDIQFAHLVWEIQPSEIRQVLRENGWEPTAIRRRKRGALSVQCKQPIQGSRNVDKEGELRHILEQWLTQRFPNGADRDIVVRAWVTDVIQWDADYKPVAYGDEWKAEVDIFKSEHGDTKKWGEGPHPYA